MLLDHFVTVNCVPCPWRAMRAVRTVTLPDRQILLGHKDEKANAPSRSHDGRISPIARTSY